MAIALTDPLLEVSETVGLDRPSGWIHDLRHDDDDHVEPGSDPREIFVPTEDDPVHLWVTGDSLTNTVGPALVRASAATEVVEPRDEVVYSSGLTRPDFFDWPDHLARGLSDERAEIVVFMVGANDGQPIETAEGWFSPDTEEWRAEYRSRVAETMDTLTAWATTIYWVGQPISRSDDHSARIAVMNSLFEAEAAERPGVRFVDSWDLFADEDGSYSAYLPDESGKPELVRDDDGVHLNPAGAERLVREIMAAIRLDWEIPE